MEEVSMPKLRARANDIKAAIEALPEDEYAQLRQWFADRDWEIWDRQLELDSEAGKLDFLIKEVLDEKRKEELKEL
jgi:hypothetical protein